MKSIATIASILFLSMTTSASGAEYNGDAVNDSSTTVSSGTGVSASSTSVSEGTSSVNVSIDDSILGILMKYFIL